MTFNLQLAKRELVWTIISGSFQRSFGAAIFFGFPFSHSRAFHATVSSRSQPLGSLMIGAEYRVFISFSIATRTLFLGPLAPSYFVRSSSGFHPSIFIWLLQDLIIAHKSLNCSAAVQERSNRWRLDSCFENPPHFESFFAAEGASAYLTPR